PYHYFLNLVTFCLVNPDGEKTVEEAFTNDTRAVLKALWKEFPSAIEEL
ncbi:MAG: hypothetical protein FD151_1851, partial [bacterium]